MNLSNYTDINNSFKLNSSSFIKFTDTNSTNNTNIINNLNNSSLNSTLAEGGCELLGDFGYTVQGILGILSFAVLVCKFLIVIK